MQKAKRGQPFVAFPAWILKKQRETPGWLTLHEIAVLLALQSFANGIYSRTVVWPGVKTIAKIVSVSERKVVSVLGALASKGLIDRKQRFCSGGRQTNLYHLLIWDHDLAHEGGFSMESSEAKTNKSQRTAVGNTKSAEPTEENLEQLEIRATGFKENRSQRILSLLSSMAGEELVEIQLTSQNTLQVQFSSPKTNDE